MKSSFVSVSSWLSQRETENSIRNHVSIIELNTLSGLARLNQALITHQQPSVSSDRQNSARWGLKFLGSTKHIIPDLEPALLP